MNTAAAAVAGEGVNPLVTFRTISLLLLAVLAGCRSNDPLVTDEGIYVVRSACPIPGIMAGTGDITTFNPPSSRAASAIDVSAAISNVRATCNEQGDQIISTVTFTVTANRADAGPARQVVLPFFNVAVQGGQTVVAKRVGQIGLNFAAGSRKAWTTSQATVRVSRAAATLPANIRAILTRPRKAGDVQAAVDPLSDPAVRAAVAAATFEQLVGFELTEAQLRYNVTR